MSKVEERWIRMAQRGERTACSHLIRSYAPGLYAFFCAMGLSRAVAEDLSQDTFLEVWRSLHTYRSQSTFRTWLYTLGRRVAWKHFKKQKTFLSFAPNEDLDSLQEEQELLTQDELLWLMQRNDLIHQHIQSLPLMYRESIVIHYVQGLSITETAEVCQIPVGTAKFRLHQALKRLRPLLRKICVEEE